MEPLRDTPQDFERPAERPRITWRLWTIGSCCVLISFLLGIAIDIANRPNFITFFLGTNTKLTVKPKKGDIIHWISYDPNADPGYSFVGSKNGPCGAGSTPSTCIYDPTLTPGDTDVYGCVLNGKGRACSDPGVGPKSVPGQGNPGFLNRFLSILKFDFARLFGITPDLSDKNIRLLSGGEISTPIGPVKSAVPSDSAATGTSAVAEPITRVVLCQSSKPDVQDQNQTSTPNIQAVQGQFITWYPAVGYTISGLDGICDYPAGSGISSSGNQTCQIKQNAQPSSPVFYKISTSGQSSCGDSGTQQFSVQVVPSSSR